MTEAYFDRFWPVLLRQQILGFTLASEEDSPGGSRTHPINRPRPEVEALSRSIIADQVGFDKGLKAKGRGFNIDMYITKPGDPDSIPELGQEEALPKFVDHIREIDRLAKQNKLPPQQGWNLIRANLISTITFREEDKRVAKGEEKTPYDEYLMLVSGFRPRYILLAELDENRRLLVERLHMTGFSIAGYKLEDIQQALRGYQERHRVITRFQVENDFGRYRERYRVQLGDRLGVDLSPVNFQIVWKEENAFWMMWERILLEENFLWANWHPRQRRNWDRGNIERNAIHEPMHFYMGYLIGKEIATGRLDPAVGIFPIPSPACFQSEGIAQTIDDLAQLDTSLDCKLSTVTYRLEKTALNNGLFMVEGGMSQDEAVRATKEYMPLKSDAEIKQLLVEGTTKPFERAYLPVYGLSDNDFQGLNGRLGAAMRNIYLRQLCSIPMTREEVMNPTLHLEQRTSRDES